MNKERLETILKMVKHREVFTVSPDEMEFMARKALGTVHETEANEVRPPEWAMGMAARLWCYPSTETIVFDDRLATQIAWKLWEVSGQRSDDPTEEPCRPEEPCNTSAHVERLPLPMRLAALCNEQSLENGSNTPDFILGDFLASVLCNLDQAIRERDRWYGVRLEPGGARRDD